MPYAQTNLIKSDRLKKLFQEMVDYYSPTGKEHELTENLAAWLRKADLPVQLNEVNDDRFNLEVVPEGAEPEIAFVGHLDTVPAYDLEDYGYREEEDRIFGLGTADMKGGCAALIEGFLSYMEKSGDFPLKSGLFLVVGEEENGDGIESILKKRGFSHALVAEPTDLIPCLTHYGYVEMEVRAFGRRRHASLAGREYNAIFSMLQMLLRVGGLVEADYPEAVLNIRDLHSSESGFAVPDQCEAFVDFHLPPSAALPRLIEEVKRIVENTLQAGAASNYELEFPTLAKGYRCGAEDFLATSLQKIYDRRGLSWAPGSFRSQSDANIMNAEGTRPIILGPGQLGRAHTRDESVVFAQLEQAADIYLELLRKIEEE